MPRIQPFYDPSFDAGAPVALTYWTSFVGTRTEYNKQKMKQRLAAADPSRFQDEIVALQESINELMDMKAKSGRDTQQGLQRWMDGWMRGEQQVRKAGIDAAARTAGHQIDAAVDLEELTSEERTRFAEQTTLPPEVTQILSGAIEAVSDPNMAPVAAQQHLEAAMATAMQKAEAGGNPLRTEAVRAHLVSLGLSAINAGKKPRGMIPHFNHYGGMQGTVGSMSVATDPAEVLMQMGGTSDAAIAARRQRILSMGAGGGGGGGGASLELLQTGIEMTNAYADQTQGDINALIADRQAQLDDARRRQAAAQSQATTLWWSGTPNPMLAPVFHQEHRDQGLIDSMGAVSRQHDGLGALDRMGVALSTAGGDPRSVDIADIAGEAPRHVDISPHMSGEWLLAGLHREISEAGQAVLFSGDYSQLDRIDSAVAFIESLPPTVRAEHAALFDEVIAGHNALKAALPGAASAAAQGDPAPFQAAIRHLERPTALLAQQAQVNDIHFGQVVASEVARAERLPARDRMSAYAELANFAETAGPTYGGDLAGAVVSSYDEREQTGDGRGLVADMQRLQDKGLDAAEQAAGQRVTAGAEAAEFGLPRAQAETISEGVDLSLAAQGHILDSKRPPPPSSAHAARVIEKQRRTQARGERVTPINAAIDRWQAGAPQAAPAAPVPPPSERPADWSGASYDAYQQQRAADEAARIEQVTLTPEQIGLAPVGELAPPTAPAQPLTISQMDSELQGLREVALDYRRQIASGTLDARAVSALKQQVNTMEARAAALDAKRRNALQGIEIEQPATPQALFNEAY